MLQLFQSYVGISVLMLQFASVLSGWYICFTHMLQLYVLNVSSISVVCCIQVFHVSEVESPGEHGLGTVGWGAASRRPAVGARNAPRIPRTGRAHPRAGCRVPPAQR
jgi:hypothetical protein